MEIASAKKRHLAAAAAAMVLALATALAWSALTHAQTPTPSGAGIARTGGTLPIRRVVLYKNGVGYFEHVGRVRGNASVSIDFTSGQLDDVLASLTTLDLDGGRVSSVSYNTETALDRQLATLRIGVGADATRAQLLGALRGSTVDVTTAGGHVTGRLLGVERMERGGSQPGQVDAVSIVTVNGALHTIALDPEVSVRIADREMGQEVGRYLSLVSAQRSRDARRMTIATMGVGDRDLFVSYVSEAPVWKASYRLVLPGANDTRASILQGWAVVDNTSGADWENVALSLVAGAPQSFIQTISRPVYVQRPTVAMTTRSLTAPQTHQSALATGGPGALAGTVTDPNGAVIPGATVRVTRGGVGVGVYVTDTSGRFRLGNLTAGSYAVTATLVGFAQVTRPNILVTDGMETVLNVRLEPGGRTDEVTVRAEAPMIQAASGERSFTVQTQDSANLSVGGIGRAGGSMIDGVSPLDAGGGRSSGLQVAAVGAALAAQQSAADAGQRGDLFEYALRDPITIRRGQSALVPIVAGNVTAEKVSLWNSSGNSTRPLRAVWLTNTAGVTLDGGGVAIVDGQTFAGEALLDALRPGERRLVSYASDLAVAVTARAETLPTRVTRVQIARGFVVQQTEERQQRTYVVRNEDPEPRAVVVEHPVRTGWAVTGSLAPAETTATWYRFRLTVAPKTTATFTVDDTRPGATQYAVGDITDERVDALVQTHALDARLDAALRAILARKAALARLDERLTAHTRQVEQITADQERMRGNMQSLKGSRDEKRLLQRYVKQLDDEETQLATVRAELQRLTAERARAQEELNTAIGEL